MTVVERDGWRLSWRLTERNGLVLHDCAFRGLRVARSMHIPFIYVQYDGKRIGAFTDHLVSERGKVEIRSVTHGFDVATRYDGYGDDYLYEQVCRFNADGSFGIRMIIYGPGEDNNGGHTYYVPFRLDLDVSGSGGDSFQRWLGGRRDGSWVDVARETAQPSAKSGPSWRVVDRVSGRAATVQADDGDDAICWPIRYSLAETAGAVGSVQPTPPGDDNSVPAIFATGQSVQDADIVLWYIATRQSLPPVVVCGPWLTLSGY